MTTEPETGERTDGAERTRTETVGLLQDLGLKEYEARCFLALTEGGTATARGISDRSEVPRTRVYDAIRVLESRGLVEVQHSSPQQFRAVGVEEGTATLRQQFDDRIDSLKSNLASLERREGADDADRLQEVWSLTGAEGIRSRTLELIESAESEILLLIVEADLLTEALFDRLRAAIKRGVDVVVGGITEDIVSRIESELPSATAFETELGWLVGPDDEEEVAISRILLVDRTTLLVSSFYPDGDTTSEGAVFATGLGNGIVVLIRRLISSGLFPRAVPSG